MKGLELPISALILIVIGVVVLIAFIIFFYPANKSINVVDLDTAKNFACGTLTNLNCAPSTSSININNFDADRDGNHGADEKGIGWSWGTTCPTNPADLNSGDNLASLCACNYNGITTDDECKQQICNCPH